MKWWVKTVGCYSNDPTIRIKLSTYMIAGTWERIVFRNKVTHFSLGSRMKMGKLEECKDIDQTSESVPNFTFRQCRDSEQVRLFFETFPSSVSLTL